jgi:hypothetical protein
LPLNLVATLVDIEDRAAGYASLVDTCSGRPMVVAVGDMLALEARLVAVEEQRILLDNCEATGASCRREFLPLDENVAEAGAKETSLRPSRKPPAPSSTAGVRATGPGRYEVSRGALDAALSNTVGLARMARIVPAQRKGQPAGFMLSAVRPGSLYTQLGFQDGDIIQSVSGRPIRAPEDALQLMTVLRSAQHLTISFLRHARPITHDYTVVNR